MNMGVRKVRKSEFMPLVIIMSFPMHIVCDIQYSITIQCLVHTNTGKSIFCFSIHTKITTLKMYPLKDAIVWLMRFPIMWIPSWGNLSQTCFLISHLTALDRIQVTLVHTLFKNKQKLYKGRIRESVLVLRGNSWETDYVIFTCTKDLQWTSTKWTNK